MYPIVWVDGVGRLVVLPIMWSLSIHAEVEFGCDNFPVKKPSI
jgi:hypothetical protein